MADDVNTDIDTDNMSMEQLSEMKGKMVAGEDIAPVTAEPEPQPEPTNDDPEVAAAQTEADADQHAEAGEQGSKTVPHKTFHYERERRKAAEKLVQDERDRFARLEERTKLLLEAQNKPAAEATTQPAEDEIPDPEKDPLAAIKWVRDQIAAKNKTETEQRQTQQRQQQEQRQFQEVFERVNADYSQATQADPTVTEAHNALRRSIGEELIALGRTQQQALQELTQIENQHLMYIAQTGQNVGDYIKRLASTRGWKPETPKAAEPAPAQTAQQPNPKLEQARQAGASLGSSGGAVANSGTITPQMLADMPEADFKAYMEKHGSTRRAFEQA